MAELWSWSLSGLALTMFWVTGKKQKWGWLLGVFMELLWFIYGTIYKQYGFSIAAFLFAGIYLVNWFRWRKHENNLR